jgi:hypothetical protein
MAEIRCTRPDDGRAQPRRRPRGLGRFDGTRPHRAERRGNREERACGRCTNDACPGPAEPQRLRPHPSRPRRGDSCRPGLDRIGNGRRHGGRHRSRRLGCLHRVVDRRRRLAPEIVGADGRRRGELLVLIRNAGARPEWDQLLGRAEPVPGEANDVCRCVSVLVGLAVVPVVSHGLQMFSGRPRRWRPPNRVLYLLNWNQFVSIR